MVQRLEHLRIVIGDDHNEVRRTLAGFLSGLGAIVRECADDALTELRHLQPDLVLCDIAMPGKDGFELLREIRSLDRSEGGEVPVVTITGLTRALDRMRAPAAGFDAILLKPFTPDALLQVVSEVIQRRM